MQIRFPGAAVTAALLVAMTACEGPTPLELDSSAPSFGVVGSELPTIADIAVTAASDPDNPEFTILVAALQAADLVGVLDGKDYFTVFAPTDAAFARLLDKLGMSADELLGNVPLLTDVLLYHVAYGPYWSDAVLGAERIPTVNGADIFPKLNDMGAFIVDGSPVTDDAQLLAPDLIDIQAANGVVHVIDEVLLPGAEEPTPTIAGLVASLASSDDPEFTILLAALEAADLVGALDGKDYFTVFAPTDAAFARLLDKLGVSADELLGNVPLLTDVLLYHVAYGPYWSDAVLAADRIPTVNGADIFPKLNDKGAFIVDGSPVTDDAQLLAPDLIDIQAANGVVHVIDEVLLPGADEPEEPTPTIAGLVASLASSDNPEFTILLAALEAADLVGVLDGKDYFTVFAPTDAAFARLLDKLGVSADELLGNVPLLTDVLLYHVAYGPYWSDAVLAADRIPTVNGADIFPKLNDKGAFIVDGSPVTDDAQLLAPDLIDIVAANGVVHVIDEVLLPGADEPEEPTPTIAGLVASLASSDNPEFTILLAALEAADLVGVLDGKDYYTVFAPTDAAFARLLDKLGVSADELLGNVPLLTDVLLYHVAYGPYWSDAVLGADRIPTVNGADIFPKLNDKGAFIVDGSPVTDDAQLLAPDLIDIVAANGIIHVIDEVLLF